MICDPRMERAILGSLLLDGTRALEQCLRLRAEMFGLDSHRTIYRVLLELLATSPETDELSLTAALDRENALDSVGGRSYLSGLTEGLPRKLNTQTHIATVVEFWKRRKGLELCERGRTSIEANDDAVDVLARLQEGALDILQESQVEDSPLVADHVAAVTERFLSPHVEQRGLSYGCAAMDDKTGGGMMDGEITIIGARNGVGKSRLMIQAVHANASSGVPVDVFSHEMKREAILRGLASIESGVPARKIRKPVLANLSERRAVEEALLRIGRWPLRVYERSSVDINQVCAYARMDIRNHGVRLVCEDYAQIVPAEGKDERAKVSKVSRALTALAKDEAVCVLLLSQLRKVPFDQYNKPPTLADLRETGQMGDDGHVIALIHRGYDEETAGLKSDGEILLPKQREGDTGAFPVQFNRDTLVFA